jgi:L-methionine (R)-S-oxide reductase
MINFTGLHTILFWKFRLLSAFISYLCTITIIMAEDLVIPSTVLSRSGKYEILLPQIESLISGEKDQIANLANVAAALKYGMGFFWVGFYLVKDSQLVLGPFQGPVACTRIGYGKGVCGTSWKQKQTIIVEDVETFPGHIACSSLSRSEIVVPLIRDDEVRMVLDVDSDKTGDFSETDKSYLERLMLVLGKVV